MEIQIIAEDGCYPTKNSIGDAGYDLYAAEDVSIPPKSGKLVRLGIRTAFHRYYVAQLWDRSGIASNHSVHRFAGVIDSNYRGEWKVYLFNHNDYDFGIKRGDKVCQALFQPVLLVDFEPVDTLPVSDRDEKGFGSSGT